MASDYQKLFPIAKNSFVHQWKRRFQVQNFFSIAKEVSLMRIFPERISWNKETFDAAARIAEEMQKENPDPFIVGMGGMVIFKGVPVKLEEIKYLAKMHDPAKALCLFSRSYEHFKFLEKENKFKEKYEMSLLNFFVRQILYFFAFSILLVILFALFRGGLDRIFDANEWLRFDFFLGFIFALTALLLCCILYEWRSFKNGRDFLEMLASQKPPVPDTSGSKNSQVAAIQTSEQKQNTVSNKIYIRVSI